MKKQVFIISLLLMTLNLLAQTRGFNYKAKLSDDSGVFKLQTVNLRFTFIDKNKLQIYQEEQTKTTDTNGIINPIIGEGSVIYGDFSAIDWSIPYMLKVEIDTGDGYSNFGTTEFQGVPYAKYAENAGNVFSGSFNDLTDIPEFFSTRSTSTVTEINDLTDARTLYNSVFLGENSGSSITNGTNNIAVGFSTLKNNTSGFKNMAIGSDALYTNTTGHNNTAIGKYALYKNKTANHNIAIGTNSLYNNTGSYNTALGTSSLWQNTSGTMNIAVGYNTLYLNKTGNRNIAIGYKALKNNSSSYNIAVGYNSLYSNTAGNNNTAIGISTLYNNTTGTYNTAVGGSVLYNNKNGTHNVALGYKSMYFNNSGLLNTASGFYSLYFNTSGYSNAAFGKYALYNNKTGYNNTAIGAQAFYNGSNYHNSTAVGAYTNVLNNNEVRLGNSYITWIGGHSPWHNTSDGRFKKNIKEDVPGLNFITRLRPVSYNWDLKKLNRFIKLPKEGKSEDLEKQEKLVHTGFIAQEVEKAARETGYKFDGIHVPENEKDVYSLAYAQFVVPLIKAVQEQQKQIEDLQKQIQELKNKK